MDSTFQTTSINDFLNKFAGRKGMQHYDDRKPTKVAECNRDFVWKIDMQQEFICSILEGFPIPAMCITNQEIVDGGNRSTTLWRYKNGEFKIELNGTEIDYETMRKDCDLFEKWVNARIPVQQINNASSSQVAQIYENLNKGVLLTFGQLLDNRKYCAWVAMTAALIGRDSSKYPDTVLIRRVWASEFKQTKPRRELGFAFQVLVGAELGPEHFHMSFVGHISLIMGESIPTTGRLHTILDMLDSCDPEQTISAKKTHN